MASSNDTSNIYQHSEIDEAYWKDYLEVRAHYDSPFYQTLYDYHKSHHGAFGTAHDVAAGPGQVAAELRKHFDHVNVSDLNSTHIKAAERLLDSTTPGGKLSFLECSTEKLADIYPPNSADFIAAAECLPLIDAEESLQAFHTTLKPNGTLAAWFYGRPNFAEPKYASSCQPLLESILTLSFEPLVKGGGAESKAGWKRATNRMASFLDDVNFDDKAWSDVERYKWNEHLAMPFWKPEACDFEITISSAIQGQEKVVSKHDPHFWENDWDLNAVRRFVVANLPAFAASKSDESIESLYQDLSQAMGGAGAVRKITWPTVLILASKR